MARIIIDDKLKRSKKATPLFPDGYTTKERYVPDGYVEFVPDMRRNEGKVNIYTDEEFREREDSFAFNVSALAPKSMIEDFIEYMTPYFEDILEGKYSPESANRFEVYEAAREWLYDNEDRLALLALDLMDVWEAPDDFLEYVQKNMRGIISWNDIKDNMQEVIRWILATPITTDTGEPIVYAFDEETAKQDIETYIEWAAYAEEYANDDLGFYSAYESYNKSISVTRESQINKEVILEPGDIIKVVKSK